MPRGALKSDCIIIIITPVPIETGIFAKRLLDRNTIKPSVKVRIKMLIAPNKGVQIKNLLYMSDEK